MTDRKDLFAALCRAADEIITALRTGDITPMEAAEAWDAERARIKEETDA